MTSCIVGIIGLIKANDHLTMLNRYPRWYMPYGMPTVRSVLEKHERGNRKRRPNNAKKSGTKETVTDGKTMVHYNIPHRYKLYIIWI